MAYQYPGSGTNNQFQQYPSGSSAILGQHGTPSNYPSAPPMPGSSTSLPYPTSQNPPGMPQPYLDNVASYPSNAPYNSSPAGMPQPYPPQSGPPYGPGMPVSQPPNYHPNPAYPSLVPASSMPPQPGFSNSPGCYVAPAAYGASAVPPCYAPHYGGKYKKKHYKYKNGRYYSSSSSSDEEFKYIPKGQRKQVKKVLKPLKKFTGNKLPF